jgi:hypothetical protein
MKNENSGNYNRQLIKENDMNAQASNSTIYQGNNKITIEKIEKEQINYDYTGEQDYEDTCCPMFEDDKVTQQTSGTISNNNNPDFSSNSSSSHISGNI